MSYKALKSLIRSRSHRIKSTLLVLIIIAGCLPTNAQSLEKNLVVGAERIDQYIEQLQNKNIAIVANATSVVRKSDRNSFTHLVDTLLSRKIAVSKIFSPEHGFRTTADAGEKVSSGIDPGTGIKIVSLYGKHRKPTKEDLKNVDLILFDIQDVGVRFYTYIATLQYVMEAAADYEIPMIVLDRPNPNGDIVDGPVMEKENTSFLGLQPIPLVYGLTIGEYANLLNDYVFSVLSTTSATTVSPVIFTAVLSISKIRSTPTIRAIPDIGSPTCSSTIASVINPIPGTPAVPIEAKVAMLITVIKSIVLR